MIILTLSRLGVILCQCGSAGSSSPFPCLNPDICLFKAAEWTVSLRSRSLGHGLNIFSRQNSGNSGLRSQTVLLSGWPFTAGSPRHATAASLFWAALPLLTAAGQSSVRDFSRGRSRSASKFLLYFCVKNKRKLLL